MNLSAIRRLAEAGDVSVTALRYLLRCKAESEMLDYKQDFRIDVDKQLCDFARDVLGMKNVGGLHCRWRQRQGVGAVGLPHALPYDTKLLRHKIRHVVGVDLDLDIVHHNINIDNRGVIIAVIYIRSSDKRSRLIPIPSDGVVKD